MTADLAAKRAADDRLCVEVAEQVEADAAVALARLAERPGLLFLHSAGDGSGHLWVAS